MNASDLKLRNQLAVEPELRKKIPYASHIDKHTVVTDGGDYLRIIRLQGASFDSADDEQVNIWHEQLNNLWRSIADTRLSIWTHLVRRDADEYPEGKYPPGFAADFNDKYRDRVAGELLQINELYITLVYRPVTSAIGRKFVDFLKTRNHEAAREDRRAALDDLQKKTTETLSALDRYDPEMLGIYEQNKILFSSTLEFLAFLHNGTWHPMPIKRQRAGDYMGVSRPSFGRETIEIRPPVGQIYGAMLGFNAYPSETQIGSFNGLLSAPFNFILTQSFTFMSKGAAKWAIKTSRNQMENTDDDAKSQIDELEQLLDNLESNRLVMGEHHLSLYVQGSSLRELELNIADSIPLIGAHGAVVAREDLAVEAAFWAMLPGIFVLRPRLSPISSRNFSAMAPLHNYPTGRLTGNHWGDAITTLVTSARTALHFSFHASDPDEPDGGTKKDVGHALLLGPTGAGKTTFVATMVALLQKFDVTSVFFTKDRDLEILIRALGGRYLPLQSGVSSGCNPFALPPSPENILFWNRFVVSLINRPVTREDEEEIKDAINFLSGWEDCRRLGRLLDHVSPTRPDGVFQHLRQWCYARHDGEDDGLYAWAFDNEHDTVAPLLADPTLRNIGFDTTSFLDDSKIRTPMNLYLFHLTNSLIDGRRFSLWISEFWKALDDPAFSGFAKNQLKTIRKQNGFVVLDSQSPSDALNHPIAATLIEQTPTKVLFPNPDADAAEYIDKLSLSEREFQLIKQDIRSGSREFLLKQGRNSVVAKLDLKGFDFELDVLSARTRNIATVQRLIEQHGDDPAVWLPLLKAERTMA